jgi:hypothetical protein
MPRHVSSFGTTVRVFEVVLLAALLGTIADAQDAPPPTPPKVVELVAKLADPDAAARAAACDGLADIGALAVPAVIAALADDKQRGGAMETLARMGPVAKSAAAALVAIAQDAASPARVDAVRALGTLGGAGTVAYAPLAKLLGEADAKAAAQVEAATAIRRIALRAATTGGVKTAKPTPVEASVQSGLDWLARHQDPDGKWSCADFGQRCERPGECSGPGRPNWDAGITGLVVETFLCAGETQLEGPHAANVKSGLAYLRRVQDAEGCIGGRASMQFIYNHAIGALALVDAYGRTGAPALADPSRRALVFTLAARNPDMAWRYSVPPTGDNDTSVTVWNAKVLDAAAAAGLDVDPAAMNGALKWIDQVTDEKTGRAGYTQKGGGPGRTKENHLKYPPDKSEALTAAALETRICVGRTRESDPYVGMGETLLAKCAPVFDAGGGGTDLYYWMHGAEALHRLGGPAWEGWKKALTAALVPNQLAGKGCGKGSWYPNDPWCGDGGRIYMTAACVLALEPCADEPTRRPAMPAPLRSCVSALEKALKSKEASVRLASVRALEAIRGAYR